MKKSDGPFKDKIQAEELGILKEVYTTYRVTDGYLEKSTVTRDHKVIDNDYHDTTKVERLVEVSNG